MRTLTGFALGMLLSFGAAQAVSAAGTSVVASAPQPPAGIEVIVVTAKRPAAAPVEVAQPIFELVVTGKRAAETNAQRTPPTAAIEMPKVELAVAEPLVIQL